MRSSTYPGFPALTRRHWRDWDLSGIQPHGAVRVTHARQHKALRFRIGVEAFFRVHSHISCQLVLLLPLPGFIGAFLAASWVLALLLFAATGANPFIYFQF